jgi:hypothetical protein
VGVSNVIRVLPIDEAGANRQLSDGLTATDPLAWAPHRRFTPSGRAALDAALASLALEPAEEVLITNASAQTYVSSCVTCTVFNHCQPSRVLTDMTRAIVMIHEYGYPHPRLRELQTEARRRGIPLIEDCAHSLDSTLDGKPLGSFGDFAIFSLSKVMPLAAGGVLVSALPISGQLSDADVEAAYRAQLPALPEYTRRRKRNYDAIVDACPTGSLLLEAGPGVTPWYACLLSPDAPEIKRRSAAIEWGTTLREDLLLVTTNPFAEPGALVAALKSAITRPKQGE